MIRNFISKRLRALIGAMMLAVVPATFVAAPVASAQGTKVIVYDQERVMLESKAGKDIATKLKAMSDATKTQLKPEGDALESERKSLESRTANMTQQAVAADQALVGQLESYARKVNAYGVKVQKNGQELALTERAAWQEFFTELEPVLQEVLAEQSAQIILERGSVVLLNPSVDVTAAVISKLDARKATINVVRQKIPDQAPAQ